MSAIPATPFAAGTALASRTLPGNIRKPRCDIPPDRLTALSWASSDAWADSKQFNGLRPGLDEIELYFDRISKDDLARITLLQPVAWEGGKVSWESAHTLFPYDEEKEMWEEARRMVCHLPDRFEPHVGSPHK